MSLRRAISPFYARVAVAALVFATPPAVLAHRCTGDCDASDTVSINELVIGVRIALGQLPLDVCPQFDADFDNRVSINELQVAINNYFSYCGHGSPPTPTYTRTATRTPTAEASPDVEPSPNGAATASATASATAISDKQASCEDSGCA